MKKNRKAGVECVKKVVPRKKKVKAMDFKFIDLGQITMYFKHISAESCMLYLVEWGFVRIAGSDYLKAHSEIIRNLLRVRNHLNMPPGSSSIFS